MLNGILAFRGQAEYIVIVPPLMEEWRETLFCKREENIADKSYRNKSAFDIHENVSDHRAATSDTVDRFLNSYSVEPSRLDR